MTLWRRWLNRAVLVLVALVLLVVLGAAYFFARERVLDDRQVPFLREAQDHTEPSLSTEISRPLVRIRMILPDQAVQAKPLPALDVSRLRNDHPDSNFQWDPAFATVARATLADPPGRTRLDALAGPVGTMFEWRGVLPAGAWFQCRIGLLAGETEVRFSVDLATTTSEQSQRLFTETISSPAPTVSKGLRWIPDQWQPRVRKEQTHEQWVPVRVDLADWGGRAVRIRLNTEAIGPTSADRADLALWGSPEIRFPLSELVAPKARKGPKEVPILLTVFESAPDNFLDPTDNESPRLSTFMKESVAFPYFYTADVRSRESMETLLISTPAAGWPAQLAQHGYRTRAVGAFTDDMMALLDRAGFEEVHRLGHDGYDTIEAAARAASWVKGPSLPGDFVFLYLSDMPSGRLGPLRYGVQGRGLKKLGWARWQRAVAISYRDDYFGRVVDAAEESERAWWMGTVSLRGTRQALVPIVDGAGRRKTVPINEPGWALRENEVRVLFGLRSLDRWAPGVCRSPGQIHDVGPTVLGEMQIPSLPGRGRAWVPEKAVVSSDSSGVWAMRSAHAKAVVVDGRYKYIRHGVGASAKIEGGWAGRSVQLDFPAEELFDLWNDPGEKKNLARERRNLLARLRDALDELDPDPVEVRVSFLNPSGERVDAMVNCVQGQLGEVFSSVGGRRMGAYEFAFSTNAVSGDFRFRTWPPLVPFRLRLLVNGKSLDPSRIQVGRWGIPLLEIKGDEWFDKTKFGWLDGWAPPRASTATTVSLGRVVFPLDDGETP